MEYIAASEMEKPRTGEQILPWVEDAINGIAKMEGGTQALRFHKGGCKALTEEIYPLALWASGMNEPGSFTIQPKIGSQNYDAIVSYGDIKKFTFHVEITQAHKGEQEHYRLIFLEREGWAPGPSHDVKKSGTKARGQVIEAVRALTNMQAVKSRSFKLICTAIRQKLKKNYPQDTRLLVVFEDFVIAREEGINEQLIGVIRAATQEKLCPFTHIYLIGISRKLMITWERNEEASHLGGEFS